MYHERLLNYVILLIKDDVAIVLPECNKFESKNLVKSVMVVEDWLRQCLVENTDFDYEENKKKKKFGG